MHTHGGSCSVGDMVAVEDGERCVDSVCVHEQHYRPHTMTAGCPVLGHHMSGPTYQPQSSKCMC